MDFFGPKIRFNVLITIVPRLNALLVIYILPGNTGPPCNYKIVGGGGWGVPPPPQRPCYGYVHYMKVRMNEIPF